MTVFETAMAAVELAATAVVSAIGVIVTPVGVGTKSATAASAIDITDCIMLVSRETIG